MTRIRAALDRLLRQDAGQDLVEYGLLAALISIFAIGVVTLMGQAINNAFWQQVVNLAQNL